MNTFNLSDHARRTIVKWQKDNPEKNRQQRKENWKRNPEWRAKHSVIGKRVFGNPEVQAKCVSRRMENPVMKAGPQHHTGKIWRLRDPQGSVFEFKNLSEFIRTHPLLFDPVDVQWVKCGRNLRCRAMALRNLHPARVKPFGVWKGWTWVSIYERRFNDGKDLLDRRS